MAAKKKSISDEPVKKTLYTKSLTDAQMEKLDKSAEVEKVNIIIVATKKDIPYLGEPDYQSILTWIFNLPADQRTFYYNMTLIR